MFKDLETEIRLSEQVPSSFLREITMIKLLFLVLVAATYLAKGGDLKDQNTLQKSTSQVIQVLIFFQELARKIDFRIFRSGNETVIVVCQERVSNVIEHGSIHR